MRAGGGRAGGWRAGVGVGRAGGRGRGAAVPAGLGARPALLALGWLRAGLGAGVLARPAGLLAGLGVDSRTAARSAALGVTTGARDLGIGLGLVATARRSGDVREWLAVAALADAADAVAFAAGVRAGHFARRRGLAAAAFATSGVLTDLVLLRRSSTTAWPARS